MRIGEEAAGERIRPKRFGPASPRRQSQISRTSQPTSGTMPISSHQPLRLLSCSRRTPTASDGSNRASDTRVFSGDTTISTISTKNAASSRALPMLARMVNSTKNQYSDRMARPSKVA